MVHFIWGKVIASIIQAARLVHKSPLCLAGLVDGAGVALEESCLPLVVTCRVFAHLPSLAAVLSHRSTSPTGFVTAPENGQESLN